jgi:hypothetical protein
MGWLEQWRLLFFHYETFNRKVEPYSEEAEEYGGIL